MEMRLVKDHSIVKLRDLKEGDHFRFFKDNGSLDTGIIYEVVMKPTLMKEEWVVGIKNTTMMLLSEKGILK